MFYNGGLRIDTTIDPTMQETLEKEYERSVALKDNIIETPSWNRHLEPQAAHNDYSNDEEQQKLMKEDLDDL